jgi:hypothetical protein
MRGMKKHLRFAVRISCLMLSLIIGVLSYRSTTAILGLAGNAKNPTEGRIPTQRDQVDVRDNKPRPSKQRMPARTLQVKAKERNAAADPLLSKIALLQDAAAKLRAATRIPSDAANREDNTRPQYLQLFLPATPGSPHSPPV